MNDSNFRKLVLAMLCDIHAKLEIQDSVDPGLISKAILSENEWALLWEYPGLLESEENPEHVAFVADVLDMWQDIESSFDSLSDADKDKVSNLSAPFGSNPKFPGFDGNHEAKYLSAARFMVDELDRFQEFGGRVNNSHMETVAGYSRMLEVHAGLDENFGSRSADELVMILNERRHPANR